MGTYDHLTDDEQRVTITPPWVKNAYKSEKKFLEWFKEYYPYIESVNRERVEQLFNNLLWYTGQYDQAKEYRLSLGGNREEKLIPRRVPLVVNHLFDLTEQKIARLTRFKSNVKALPVNDEFEDKKSAEFADLILRQLNNQNQFDLKLQEIERWNAVFGEMFLDIDWDPTIGDKDKDGNRIGDVKYRLAPPFFKMFDTKRHYEEVKWSIEVHRIMHFEEVKKKYGKTVEPDGLTSVYSYEFLKDNMHSKQPEEVVVYRFVYPPDEFIPEGAYILFTKEKVLEMASAYPYSHNKFPFVRITDIDVPSRLHGMSLFEHLKPIQHNYNKMTSLISKNIFLVAHPKIMMPEGAAKIESMGNSATAVTFRGPVAPSVVTFPANPPEVYGFRDQLKQEMEQIGGVYGVSRGQPPSGIRAGIALQFLEEQELQRANTQIVKHNNFIVEVNEMAIGVAGDYYNTDPSKGDARLLRILGPNSQYQLRSLQNVDLSGPYTINIQKTTALSDSRAGRTQQVIDLLQNIPGIMSKEQAADILELGAPEKFYSVATAALRSAESENEELLRGEEISPPEVYEQHLVHWKAHSIVVQGRFYKEDVPEPIKVRMVQHIAVHEMFMLEAAIDNPEAAAEIRTLAGFPMFHEPTPEQKTFLVTGQVLPPQPPSQVGAVGIQNGALPSEGGPIIQDELPTGELPPTEPVPEPADIQ
jgi:hypothetical protein